MLQRQKGTPISADLVDPTRKPVIEILLGLPVVKGIESGLLHETAGDQLGPEVHHLCQARGSFTFDPLPGQRVGLAQLGEQDTLQQHVYM